MGILEPIIFKPNKFMVAVLLEDRFKYVCKLCGHDLDKHFTAIEVLRLKETEYSDGSNEHERQLEHAWKNHKCSSQRPSKFSKYRRKK
jgi:hypothetical protein